MKHDHLDNRISIEELRSLFQNRVSLISVIPGTKQMAQSWATRTDGSYPEANTNDKQLAAMGVAVRLGNRDYSIISIDIDGSTDGGLNSEVLVSQFMQLNPVARKTMVTTASRGANFWFRLRHHCPKLQKLEHAGVTVGEFRSDGGLTIIQGLHANQVDHYRFINKAPVAEVSLDELVWLDGKSMDQVLTVEMYTRILEHETFSHTDLENIVTDGGLVESGADANQVLPEAPELQSCEPGVIEEVEAIINRHSCRKPKTTNTCQVELIRELKFVLHKQGLRDSWAWKADVHRLWYEQSQPHLDASMEEDDYLIEFMDKWSRLRRKNQANEEVWNRAKNKAVPALLLKTPRKLQDTAKLCREWANQNQNNGLFNLGGKQLELVIPGINNQVGGFRYLNMLVQMGVLELVERSTSRKKTNRWRYLLKD